MSSNDAAEIAAGDVAGDHDPPLDVLAQHHVRTLLATDVGEQPNRHDAPAGVSIGRSAMRSKSAAGRSVELDDQIERRAAIEDAPDGRAGEARLDRLGHVARPQAVARDHRAVEDEPHERHVHLLLERQIDHAGHTRHRVAHASRPAGAACRDRRRTPSPRCSRACPTACGRSGARSAARSSRSCPAASRTAGAARRAARREVGAVSRRPTSISAASTPCTCSSYSARPVRRAVATTSGCDSRICSTRRPISSDLASDVPGSVLACTVRLPSWNSGRNAVPARRQRRDGRDEQQRATQRSRRFG